MSFVPETPRPSHMRSFDELYIVMEPDPRNKGISLSCTSDKPVRLCDSDMKKLIKTDVLLTPLHINTLLYNLLVGATPSRGLGASLA